MALATFNTPGISTTYVKKINTPITSEGFDPEVVEGTYCLYNMKWEQFAQYSWEYYGRVPPAPDTVGSFSISWLSSFLHEDYRGKMHSATLYSEEYVTEIIIPRFHSLVHQKMNRADMTIVPVVDGAPDFEYSVSFEQWKKQYG